MEDTQQVDCRKRREIARFILDEALAAGIRVGTNGAELRIAPTRKGPMGLHARLIAAIIANKHVIIEFILARNTP